MKGMTQDSNASCLDVALDALLAFADTAANVREHSPELAPGIMVKGLSGRPGTITRAEGLLLKLIEVIWTLLQQRLQLLLLVTISMVFNRGALAPHKTT